MTVPDFVKPEHRESVERSLSHMEDPKPLGAFAWPLDYEQMPTYNALRAGEGRLLIKMHYGKMSEGTGIVYAFTRAWPSMTREWRASSPAISDYDSERAE